jgi:M6 family metalloprotease-like protein
LLHTLIQSDGSTFQARQWGDEWHHGWETEEGYTIVFDESLKSWTYATHDFDGNLISSSKIVRKDRPPIDILKYIRPTVQPRKIIHSMKMEKAINVYQKGVSPAGTANIPVILVNFIDTNPTYSPLNFHTLLFGSGNNSLKEYFEEVSYGKFSISTGPNGVVGWYTASNTHDYYGENDEQGYDKRTGQLAREAVEAADAAGFDWSPYDQDEDCYVDVVAIIHQGTDEATSGNPTDIWGALWLWPDPGGYETKTPCSKGGFIKVNDYIIVSEILYGGINTIGAFAHEYAHALGLPDLYDTDYSSYGVGSWSLMGYGLFNYVNVSGDSPAHLDAWSKYKLGWVTPIQVKGTLTHQTITQAETTPDVYQLLSGSPSTGGEYFLIENRQKVGFDRELPGAGLLIWHIDERKFDNDHECYPGGPSCATDHYHVALVQSDNLWDLEKKNSDGDTVGDPGDPFPGLTGNTSFDGHSTPNSNLYNGNPSGVSATDISASGPIMRATINVTPPTVGPDLTGEWSSNPYQTCKITKSGLKCKIAGTLKIENTGSQNASPSIAKFYLSDNHPFHQKYDLKSVSIGKVKAVSGYKFIKLSYSLPLGYSASGQYLIAIIDPDNKVTEIDETNNVIAFGPI